MEVFDVASPSGWSVQEARNSRRHFGLGLALVIEIAARHGDSVTAANLISPESGAILGLTLPR